MKYCLALVVLHFATISISFAQYDLNTDSLAALLPELKGDSRLQVLMDLSFYIFDADAKASVAYGTQAVDLAQELKNQKLLGKSYLILGTAFNRSDQYDAAIEFYGRALEVFKEAADPKGLAYVTNNLSIAYDLKGDYDQSLNYAFQSLKLKDSLGGSELGTTYSNIGDTFRKKGDAEKALHYLFRSVEIREQSNDLEGLADSYTNIGVVYENEKNYPLALEYGLKSLKIEEEICRESGYAIGLNYLGSIYYKQGQYPKALDYYYESLAIVKRIASQSGLAYVAHGLSLVYTDLEQYDSALFYANTSLAVLNAIGDKGKKTELYQVLSSIYSAQGNYEKALTSYKDYTSLKDTIFTVEKERMSVDMESKYQSAKKDVALLTKDATIAQQKTNQQVYVGIALGLLLLSAGLLYYYKKRQARNRELQRLNHALDAKNQQNELLLKEIHHRVKINLELVKSLIALQSAQLEDSPTKDAMIASQNRVQSMGIIHQKLYQGANLSSVEMKDYFLNLGEGILDAFSAEEQVKIECVMDQLELDVDTAVPIGLIVNELLTNALKYAFPKDTAGTIHISLSRTDPETLSLCVADNGVGKSAGLAPQGTGFGSQLIRLLTQQLNGQMQEESEDGTRVSFQFHLDQAA